MRESSVPVRRAARVVRERPASMAGCVKQAYAHTYSLPRHTTRVAGTCDVASCASVACETTDTHSLAYAAPRPVQQSAQSVAVHAGSLYDLTRSDGGYIRRWIAVRDTIVTLRVDQSACVQVRDRGFVHQIPIDGIWNLPVDCWVWLSDVASRVEYMVYTRAGALERVFALAPEELRTTSTPDAPSETIEHGDLPMSWGHKVARQVPREWTKGKGIQSGGSMATPNCQVSRTSRSGIMRHGSRGSRGKR